MAQDNASIRLALQQRLTTVPGLPAVYWTDVGLTPDPLTPYILATFLVQSKKPIDNLFVLMRGALQLDVRYPIATPDAAETMAATIEAAFPSTGVIQVTLSDGRTNIDYCEAKNGIPDSPFWKVPVLIGWSQYKS